MARLIGMVATGVLAGFALAACGGSSEDGGVIIAPTSSSSGDGQTAAPGTLLPLPLRAVVTQDDVPQSGVTVTWTTDDGGTLNPTTSVTDASGIATTQWTLGTACGTQQVDATINSSSSGTATFSAVAGAETVTVLSTNAFSPATVNLPATGGCVTWIWAENAIGHNVKPSPTNPNPATPSSVGGNSALYNYPFQFTASFTTPGTYRYYCFNHGAVDGTGNVSGMSGVVNVGPPPS